VAAGFTAVMLLTLRWDIYWNSPVRGTEQWQIEFAGGRIWVVHILSWKPIAAGWRTFESQEPWQWGWTDPADLPPGAHWRCGFLNWKLPGVLNHFEMTLVYPVLAAGAAAAILWNADMRARRRARLRLCPACGYDRRGLATDAACPECGSKP
jgi:hypothetical protein